MLKENILLLLPLITVVFAMPQNYEKFSEAAMNLSNQKNEVIENFQNKLDDAQTSKSKLVVNAFRTFGREEAREETESKLSQLDSYYTSLQKKTNDIVNIKPVVDTISEHEKYGNDGGINRVASIAFINGYENVANFVNAIFDVPQEKMKTIKLNIAEVLRYLGRSLVGL